MSKKFNIREWIQPVRYWSLLVIPHLSICLIFLIYSLIGASIIQEIESNHLRTSSSLKPFQQERERLVAKLIDKKQIFDLQQYTKYVSKHLRQYEEEIKKTIKSKSNFEQKNSSWTFSESVFFIGTTLTTIGSNDLRPKSKTGKLFLMIYTAFGIPLTLVFLIDLSLLIKRLIKCLTLIFFYFYSSDYFLYIRRFIEKVFSISTEEEFNSSSNIQQHFRNIYYLCQNMNCENDLTITQLILTLSLYILTGASFLMPSKSFFDSVYLCFTSIFTINLNKYQENNVKLLYLRTIYLFFGLPIVLLCINTVKIRIETILNHIGKKILKRFTKFTQQMGLHELSTDDISPLTLEPVLSRNQHLSPSISWNTSEQQSTIRPVGIAEPLRRLSSGLIRAFRSIDDDVDINLDKSVQVNTIIRSCGRCAGSDSPSLSVKKHGAISTSSSSINENNSSFEEDDTMPFPPPNLDRMRQRRATLVAKTIINQMVTQPRSSSIDEFIPSLTFLRTQRQRPAVASPVSVTCSIKVSASSSPEAPRKRKNSQEEFRAISKQISALLTPSDDEN